MQHILFGLLLILLCGCSANPDTGVLQTPALQATSTTQIFTASAVPTFTSPASTASPSPVPDMEIFSPLEDIAPEQLAGLITNPYNPPPPGSDDPHAGIDLSDLLPDTQIAVSGRNVLASTGGRVAAVIHDRFPYGNAIIIETTFSDLPASLKDSLNLPAIDASPVPPVSLTCPDGIQQYVDQGDRSLYLLYAHLEQPSVLSLGEPVTSGQVLGTIGTTGNSLYPHLHLEIRVGPSGAQFGSMAHYDVTASVEEMTAYCTWRIGGQFQLIDPMSLFILNP